jgi:murein DD-endopeptidase MepM/ murein hydrolase activator NlpD
MKRLLNAFLVLSLAAVACNFPTNLPTAAEPAASAVNLGTATTPPGAAVAPPTLPPTPDPAASPTPDSPHSQPDLRGDSIQYVVQPFDTLGAIAEEFGVTVEELVATNNLLNPNQLEVGQVLLIPPMATTGVAPSYKIIPDSELVNGPAAIYFDTAAFIQGQGGYLASYQEQVGDEFHSGTRILIQVATDYSVNPRILLAVLEQQSGWVTNPNPPSATLAYPMAFFDTFREGLLRQLSWAADNLNRGFYDWRSGQAAGWGTVDGAFVPAAPTINAGTAGVQALFAKLYSEAQWRSLVDTGGFINTYTRLFGNPFSYAIEPLVPAGISQPTMQLPFEVGVPWVFSGGPHSGWGSGSAWAALDFAPRGDMLGCNQSADWAVAAADGLIVRSDNGAVVQDLDGDGYEQSGWTILYMHMAANGRVPVGTQVRAGDRIGHPSCEGGVSSASHLHLARRYNGVWILAFGEHAFVMDGWLSVSSGTLYDGSLQRDGQSVEACECRDPQHMLQR